MLRFTRLGADLVCVGGQIASTAAIATATPRGNVKAARASMLLRCCSRATLTPLPRSVAGAILTRLDLPGSDGALSAVLLDVVGAPVIESVGVDELAGGKYLAGKTVDVLVAGESCDASSDVSG